MAVITANSIVTSNLASVLLAEEFSSLGRFDDCLDVLVKRRKSGPEEMDPKMSFTGKYCLVNVTTPRLPFISSYSKNDKTAAFSAEQSNPLLPKDYFSGVLANSWLTLRNRFPLVLGICVPSVCSETEVELLMRKCE